MRKSHYIMCFLLLSFLANAQNDSIHLTSNTINSAHQDFINRNLGNHDSNVPAIILGYYLGSNSYGEVGFALNSYSRHDHITKSISTEFRLNGTDFIIGPKIGFNGTSFFGFTMGLNAIYYTNFSNGSWVFRPEIGVALFGVKIMYGYNWKVINSDFRGINSHQVGFVYVLPFRKSTM